MLAVVQESQTSCDVLSTASPFWILLLRGTHYGHIKGNLFAATVVQKCPLFSRGMNPEDNDSIAAALVDVHKVLLQRGL